MYDPNNLNGIREVELYRLIYPERVDIEPEWDEDPEWKQDRFAVADLHLNIDADGDVGIVIRSVDCAVQATLPLGEWGSDDETWYDWDDEQITWDVLSGDKEPLPSTLQRLIVAGFDITRLVIKYE